MLIHESLIYGPVHSRRLGTSLGINLLPANGKRCSFDCIYCECGLNKDGQTRAPFPSAETVRSAIEQRVFELKNTGTALDTITFAGSGEPTMHPAFKEIITETIALRNRLVPQAKISVLSNAVHIAKPTVFEALQTVDRAILKLDSALDASVRLINRPCTDGYSVAEQVKHFKRFHGAFTLQTMFLRGEVAGKKIDNSTEQEVAAWLAILAELRPREVMIYTLDRKTPVSGLEKIPLEVLQNIAEHVQRLNIKTIVAG